MKVKELRKWLADLGEQHKEHYHRGQKYNRPTKKMVPNNTGKGHDDVDSSSTEKSPRRIPKAMDDDATSTPYRKSPPFTSAKSTDTATSPPRKSSPLTISAPTDTATSPPRTASPVTILKSTDIAESPPRKSSPLTLPASYHKWTLPSPPSAEDLGEVASARTLQDEETLVVKTTGNSHDQKDDTARLEPNDTSVAVVEDPEENANGLGPCPSVSSSASNHDDASPDDDNVDLSLLQIQQNPSDEEAEEHDFIKQNPSADPTASTVDESIVPETHDPQAVASNYGRPGRLESWDSDQSDDSSWWDGVQMPDPLWIPSSDDESTVAANEEDAESVDSARHQLEDTDFWDGRKSSFMDHQHVQLLQMQKPPLTFDHEQEEHEDVEEDYRAAAVASMPSMHNANLFGNKTLTTSTLDFICKQEENQAQKHHSPLSTIQSQGSKDDELSLSTMSSRENSNTSINIDVQESKLGRALMGEECTPTSTVEEKKWWSPDEESSPGNEEVAEPDDAGNEGDTEQDDDDNNHEVKREVPTVRRKKIDPQELSFLKPKPVPKTTDHYFGSARRSPNANPAFAKFRGNRKKIVELRKEELEQKWSDIKTATRVSKIKWGLCHTTGIYKRQIVAEVQYK